MGGRPNSPITAAVCLSSRRWLDAVEPSVGGKWGGDPGETGRPTLRHVISLKCG
jgi:hypothetical protein